MTNGWASPEGDSRGQQRASSKPERREGQRLGLGKLCAGYTASRASWWLQPASMTCLSRRKVLPKAVSKYQRQFQKLSLRTDIGTLRILLKTSRSEREAFAGNPDGVLGHVSTGLTLSNS